MHQSPNLISCRWLLAIAQLWFQITLAKSACDKDVGTSVVEASATAFREDFQPRQDVVVTKTVRMSIRALGSRTLWSFPLWPRDLLDWPNRTLGKLGDAKLWKLKLGFIQRDRHWSWTADYLWTISVRQKMKQSRVRLVLLCDVIN